MTLFSLNINKIALLRNSRGTDSPNLEAHTKKAIEMGIKGITVHPRPDERHIRYDDLAVLKRLIDQHPEVEFNIEGYPCDKFIEIVNEIKPHQITLVPDSDDQLTSDHGWNVLKHEAILTKTIAQLKESQARICLFTDYTELHFDVIKKMGADGIELFTEPYAHTAINEREFLLKEYKTAYEGAKKSGLRVNAGHDLDLTNLAEFLKQAPVDEVSIGHAFTLECIEHGMETVAKRYLDICK